MTGETPDPARRRRYGPELEKALLEAAWTELAEVGYGRLTMESVARRARTSEPVLYRRWSNKDQLVMASLEHYRVAHPIAEPDTGSLRGDLIAYLEAASDVLAGFLATAVAAALSGLLADAGLTPWQARERVLRAQQLPLVRTIYRRAHDRGEIDLSRLPGAVLDLPFDLGRHDLFMDREPPRTDRIRSIVDDLFLPLVRHYDSLAGG
ncbi:TetR/AcrR family transcriptional regulator [Actinoplanes sp. N902-109]|uniref:TetR/AcrR family transcriptional regulator n=1 Tax=Actinoplanes sp. (strain N902-109) TaxID=649831 RepID=UPI00032965F9|nr:TetR/AcrR family transcriptional regulator [Actinoplanes sp. N902-109]AGL16446.1 TetR family transcriptional regulator [Actinoplanes sp. N902-109]